MDGGGPRRNNQTKDDYKDNDHFEDNGDFEDNDKNNDTDKNNDKNNNQLTTVYRGCVTEWWGEGGRQRR